VDARARAELQFALLDAVASRSSYNATLERVRSNVNQLYAHGLDPAALELAGISIDFEALASAIDAIHGDARIPVTRIPAGRVLEEAASAPLRGAFLARALNALASIAAEMPETALSEAVSASTDYGALIRALERAVVRGRGPEEMDPDELLDEAQLRGVRARNRLLTTDGGTVSAIEVAQRLRLTRQAVDERRKKGRLVGLLTGRRGYAYPVWQFDEAGVLPGLERVLQALSWLEPWSQTAFLLNSNARLSGETPLAALRRGRIDEVVIAAQSYGEQGGS
jgi:hypothetical protein